MFVSRSVWLLLFRLLHYAAVDRLAFRSQVFARSHSDLRLAGDIIGAPQPGKAPNLSLRLVVTGLAFGSIVVFIALGNFVADVDEH